MTPEFTANRGTVTKLETVFKYAEFYTQALKDKPTADNPFRLKYLDVFAGTGEIKAGQNLTLLNNVYEYEENILGSARRALSIERPFFQYAFADMKKKHVQKLNDLKIEFPHLEGRIFVKSGDANTHIEGFCRNLKSNDRALVFLDPFGLSVDWNSICRLAETEKVDLWYYYPCSAVTRQLNEVGDTNEFSRNRFKLFFGDTDWETTFVSYSERQQTDLFSEGGSDKFKVVDTDMATKFYMNKMGAVFKGGVSETYMRLGQNGEHKFSLIFACSNPNPIAHKLAHRVAKEIMARK